MKGLRWVLGKKKRTRLRVHTRREVRLHLALSSLVRKSRAANLPRARVSNRKVVERLPRVVLD